MTYRIKVTGYFTPDAGEADPTDRTGLTGEAYLGLVANEYGGGLRLADLEDVEVEQA